MELIIKIPDEDYEFIKDLRYLIGGRHGCKTIQQNVINAIKNGTPYNPSGDAISREALKKYARTRISEEIVTNQVILKLFDELIDDAPAVEPDLSNDLISRTELKKCAIPCEIHNGALTELCVPLYQIDNAPTVKAFTLVDIEEQYKKGLEKGLSEWETERPQGKWIKITREGTVPAEYVCSCCGRKIYDNYELSIPMSEFYPYCHCGAKMKGGAE